MTAACFARIRSAIFMAVFGCSAFAPAGLSTDYGTPEWQQEISQGYIPFKRLTLEDFKIDDKAHPEVAMYTLGFIHYSYRTQVVQHGRWFTASVTEWQVRSGLDRSQTTRKSWFQDTAKAMSHEQGHLNLNEIYGRLLARRGPKTFPVGQGESPQAALQTLAAKIAKIIDWYWEQNRSMQAQYDEDTDGGLDFLMQEKWDRAISARMKNVGLSEP
ncbi:MAG: hypothetical protein BGO01_03935 [Armatimonadetes bacterium 55-13]|nr:hypothetical protein [Armatimonadota bacterium]OJU63300.1 MAG: hypothetical protein BGO01_03935 [Armatimonadetes bacterium 55-13]